MASLKSLIAIAMLVTASLPVSSFAQQRSSTSIHTDMDTAERLLISGKANEASVILEKVAQALPTNAVGNASWSRLQLLLGRALLDRNMLYESLELLFNHNQKSPPDGDAQEGLVLMGEVLIRLNKPAEACGMLMRALALPMPAPLKYRANTGFYKAQCSTLNGYDPFTSGDKAAATSAPIAPPAATSSLGNPIKSEQTVLKTDTPPRKSPATENKPSETAMKSGLHFQNYKIAVINLENEIKEIDSIYESITNKPIKKYIICPTFMDLIHRSKKLLLQAKEIKTHNAEVNTEVIFSKDTSDDVEYNTFEPWLSNLEKYTANSLRAFEEHFDEECF